MKFLLEISTSNYKMWHSMAKRLAQIYPGSKFAAVAGFSDRDNEAWQFLNNQRDVKYEFFRIHEDIIRESLNGDIDWQVLKDFERSFPHKSLWRLISADRNWGAPYIHGAVLNKTFINQNNTRENILKVFSGLVKTYREIFDEFKPDAFLPAACMGSITVFAFEGVCRENKVFYVAPTGVRVKNYFAFANDVQLRFPQIEKTYNQLMEGKIELDLTGVKKLYNTIMSELEDPQYFDRKRPALKFAKLTSPWLISKFLFASIKAVLGTVWRWWLDRKINTSENIDHRQPYKLAVLWDNIINTLKHQLQNWQLLNPDFGEVLPKGQKYLYYPLHTSPEYSTQFQGTMWMDQLYLIEQLSKSVPADWVVYVKEHPAILVGRTRPEGFYKRIRSLPNVKLAPIDADMHKLIFNSEMVAVVTGTSGWEAVQRSISSITFSDNPWDIMGLSRRCTDVERLSWDIQDEITRIKNITPQERKKRLVCFFASILYHGFELTYPNQYGYDRGTDAQYELVGIEIADALKKYLEYLEKERENEETFQSV